MNAAEVECADPPCIMHLPEEKNVIQEKKQAPAKKGGFFGLFSSKGPKIDPTLGAVDPWSKVMVTTMEKKEIALSSVWREQRTVLCLIRRFG